MNMKYEVDQSGKVEQTERNTVLACTNGKSVTILLKKSEKRALQSAFKRVGSQRIFPYLTFSALLALLIKKLGHFGRITVDNEYTGHERLVSQKTSEYLLVTGVKSRPVIVFSHVGKLSKAHNMAHEVAVKKKKPTFTVSAKEVFTLILGTKKSGK